MNSISFRRILLALPRLLLAVAVLIHDALVVVLARPLRWLAQWQPIRRMQAWVAKQSALTVLVLLAAPVIILEPAKLIGLLWLATGRVWPGLALLVFAYGLSLVLIERIFDAGLPALLSWGWFRRGYEWFVGFRAAIMARIRALAWVQAVLSVAGWLRAQTAAISAALAQLFTTLRGWLGPR
jgi:hypothetical protein